MGTAGNIRGWSWVQDKPCACGQRACAYQVARERRLAIVKAQEALFDEPTRPTGIRRPLLLCDLTAAA
jgi:hypothetical protein